MKTIKQILLTIVVLLLSLTANAYDFEVDGIYYNIISSTDFTAEVTYGDNEYSGEVVIPTSVNYNSRTVTITRIGSSAFKNCDELIDVTIPNSVTSIAFYAFENSAIVSIAIPSNITSIDNYAFNGCTSLKNLYIEDGNTTLELGYNFKSFSDSYVDIGKGMFYDCPLETLYLGRNLNYESQKCGLSPFYRKEELLSLTIGSKVTIIGSCAFSGCSAITNVTIPNSVTGILDRAFEDCSAITNVTIPNSVTEILDGAFYYCTALKELYIEDGYTTLELGNLTFDSSLETLYLGRNLNYNYSYANSKYPPFYNHTELKSLIIGNCVSTIGNCLFCGCSAITSVIIPNSVKIIGAFAFEDCSAITNVTIPNSVTEILNGAFSGCSKLTNITIPNSVISISDKAFSDCIALKELYIEDGNTILHLGVNLWHSTSSGEGLFYDCPLETLYLGRDLGYNDGYHSGYSPFSYKRKLTSLTISTGVTSVGKNAFYECDGIDSIYLMGAVPASVCDNNFTESQFVTTRVYVPKGTLEIYQATDVWKNFWNIQEHSLIEYHTVTYRVDGEIYETQLVALGDTIPTIDEPTKEGYTFSGWSEAPETMPAEDITITGSFIPTENVSEVEFDANIQTTNNGIILLNANNNWVRVYSINGILVKKIDNYTGEEITLNKGVYIVSVGNKAIKIML